MRMKCETHSRSPTLAFVLTFMRTHKHCANPNKQTLVLCRDDIVHRRAPSLPPSLPPLTFCQRTFALSCARSEGCDHMRGGSKDGGGEGGGCVDESEERRSDSRLLVSFGGAAHSSTSAKCLPALGSAARVSLRGLSRLLLFTLPIQTPREVLLNAD